MRMGQSGKAKTLECEIMATDVKVGTKNILPELLVEGQKILLLLHKIGLDEAIYKALPQDRPCFKYLTNKFPFITHLQFKGWKFCWSSNKEIYEG